MGSEGGQMDSGGGEGRGLAVLPSLFSFAPILCSGELYPELCAQRIDEPVDLLTFARGYGEAPRFISYVFVSHVVRIPLQGERC